MSTELQTTTNAQLPVIQRAALALGITEERKAELRELAAKTVSIVAITNADGYRQAHAGRMALKNERVDLEKLGKAARQDATDFSKAVIALEKVAIAIIAPEEQRLQDLQTAYDEAEERAKQAKIEAEIARVAAIDAAIESIRRRPQLAMGKTSEQARGVLAEARDIVIDESFEEKTGTAQEALQTTLMALEGIVAERERHDAEQKRIAEEREELARLRALQAAHEAAERAKIAEEERKAREAREAEDRAARAKLAGEHAELVRQQTTEADRIRAENKRLADERAAFEREQAEAKRKADEVERARQAVEAAKLKAEEDAKRLAKKSRYPGASAIVAVLANHFEVTEAVVNSWLTELRSAA